MILGIDEVGRGPWAGPLVVGAVVLGETVIEGLADSKVLSKAKRKRLANEVYSKAQAVGLGWVTAHEIDEIGLSAALRVATVRAVEKVTVPYHEIIIDGTINFLEATNKGKYVTTLAKADALIASVSAASIVAKVARDAYMATQDEIYQGYGFGSHAGYGTAKHRAAIEELGVTPLHRLSFAPLKKYQDRAVLSESKAVYSTTKMVGDAAEEIVAEYLQNAGHRIIERNWKTKWCEIDIISEHQEVVYFTEVKYRRTNVSGDGLAAITPKKLRQMKFAATLYETNHRGIQPQLAVAAVSGDKMSLDGWMPLV